MSPPSLPSFAIDELGQSSHEEGKGVVLGLVESRHRGATAPLRRR